MDFKVKAYLSLSLMFVSQVISANYDSDAYYHTPQPQSSPRAHGYYNLYPYYENPSKTYYYNYPYGGYYNYKFKRQKSAANYYNYKRYKEMSDEYNRYRTGYRHFDSNDFDD